MKNCIGVNPKAYSNDPEGRRLSPTPFLHYPDFCPYWLESNKEGDCYKNCDEIPSMDRPCYRAAFKLDEQTAAPETASVEEQIHEDESKLTDVPFGEGVVATSSEGPYPPSANDGEINKEGRGEPVSAIPHGWYWCSQCKRPHKPDSRIGKRHQQYNNPEVTRHKQPAIPAPAKPGISVKEREEVQSLIIREAFAALITQAEAMEARVRAQMADFIRKVKQTHDKLS